MFDGVDAGLDGPLDGLGSVGVGGDLAAGLVGGVGGDLELFEGVLGGSGLVSLGEDAAGGHDLDDIDTVFHLLADGLADLVGAVGASEFAGVGDVGDGGLGGVVVEVAVASGDGEAGAGGDDARAGDVAGVDVVAEVDGEEGDGAYVADGGEAGFEGLAGVDYAGDGGVEGGAGEGVDLLVAVGAGGEVGVAVDEAGEDVVGGEVEDLRSGGWVEAGGLD